MIDVKSVLKENAELCEKKLIELTTEDKIGKSNLTEAMKYSLLGGGKRIRATLVIEFAKMFGGSVEDALYFASAIEMIHAYSLIHDDLPCMDDDDIRRGKPSCHKQFDEATALLAGDTLLTYAFEVISKAENVSASAIREIVLTFAYYAGSLGMADGQNTDLEGQSRTYEELKELHSKKTGGLIKIASLAGYLSTVKEKPDENIIKDIEAYGECIGLAFQIKDDLLDLEGDAAVLGKAVGIDEKNGRVNALTFMTPDEARAECVKLSEEAKSIISKYDNNEFLAELPFFLNNRNK